MRAVVMVLGLQGKGYHGYKYSGYPGCKDSWYTLCRVVSLVISAVIGK